MGVKFMFFKKNKEKEAERKELLKNCSMDKCISLKGHKDDPTAVGIFDVGNGKLVRATLKEVEDAKKSAETELV